MTYSNLVKNPILLSIEAVDSLKSEWIDEIYGSMNNKTDGKAITPQVKNLLPLQVCFDSQTYNRYQINNNKTNPYVFESRSENFKTNIKNIQKWSFRMWILIGITSVVYLIFFDFMDKNPFAKKQPYLTIVPKQEDAEVYKKNPQEVSSISNLIASINQPNSLFRTSICTAQSSEEKVLVIYPLGHSSFTLSDEVANTSKIQMKAYEEKRFKIE